MEALQHCSTTAYLPLPRIICDIIIGFIIIGATFTPLMFIPFMFIVCMFCMFRFICSCSASLYGTNPYGLNMDCL